MKSWRSLIRGRWRFSSGTLVSELSPLLKDRDNFDLDPRVAWQTRDLDR